MAGTFGQPLTRVGWLPAGGEASHQEVYDAAREAMIYVDNINGRVAAAERAYDDRIDAIRRLTGETLVNPFRVDPGGIPGGIGAMPTGTPSLADALRLAAPAIATFDERVAAIVSGRPEIADQIGFNRPIEEDVNRVVREAAERAAVTLGSNPRLSAWAASFAGGFVGMFRDPVQSILMLLGGGAGGAKTVAGRIISAFGREAAVNAAAEAALQPFIQSNRATAGLPAGIGPALGSIGFAALLGGTFGAGTQGLAEGARALLRLAGDTPAASPVPNQVRGAAAAVEVDEAIAAARPTGIAPDAHELALSRSIGAAERPADLAAARAAVQDTVEPARAGAVAADSGAAAPAPVRAPQEVSAAELRTARAAAEERVSTAPEAVAEPDAEPVDVAAVAARVFTEAVAELPEEVRAAFRAAEPGAGTPEEALVARLAGQDVAPAPGGLEGRAVGARRNEGQPFLLLSDRGRTLRDTGARNVVLVGPAAELRPRLAAAYPMTNFLTVPEAAAFMRSGAPTPEAWRASGATVPPSIAALGRRAGEGDVDFDATAQAEALAGDFAEPAAVTLPDGVSLQDELLAARNIEGIAGLVESCRLL